LFRDDAVFDEPESTAPPFLSYIGTDISGKKCTS